MIFHWTPMTLLISLTVLAAAVVSCAVSWRRSGYRPAVGWLELFRFVLILMALIVLNQPEQHQKFVPVEKPSLIVLHDTSKSMQTADVLPSELTAEPAVPSGNAAIETGVPADSGRPLTRRDAIAPLLNSAFWISISGPLDVVFQPFSSDISPPENGTDLHSALKSISTSRRNVRGIVLLSDGDWNIGDPPGRIASQLRMQEIPVFAVRAGSEQRLPDVELSASDTQAIGVSGKIMRIPFRIQNWLAASRDLTVTLIDSEGKELQKTVKVAGMGQVQDTLDWKPETAGDQTLTIKIPIDQAEVTAENNQQSIPVSIRSEELRVLLVDAWPRWEYRYLRNALERDPGVQLNCLLFHPDLQKTGGGRGYLEQFPAAQDLFEYDVVFLGDVGVGAGQLTIEQCEQLRQLVRSHAAGLVFLPGFHGNQKSLLTTQLEELYPVITDPTHGDGIGRGDAARYRLTDAGRRSLLTRLEPDEELNERVWTSLPGFHWHAAALRARIGSQVLVVHDSETGEFGRIPLIVTRTAGTGKVLFMGTDSAWRWRRGIEDLYHYRFWGQVVRWMAYQRNMSRGESMRLFYSPDRPQTDGTITLNANVMNSTGEPLRSGTVDIQALSPSGLSTTIRLTSAGEDSWGLFTGTLTPRESGTWLLTTTCVETGAQLQTSVSVAGEEREKVGRPARIDVLQELTNVTRGQLLNIGESANLIRAVASLPEPQPSVRKLRIWSHPVLAIGLISLLGIFWTCRKLAGMV